MRAEGVDIRLLNNEVDRRFYSLVIMFVSRWQFPMLFRIFQGNIDAHFSADSFSNIYRMIKKNQKVFI